MGPKKLGDTTRKKWQIGAIVMAVICIALSITIIVLANTVSKELFDLLETFPGALGIDVDGNGSKDGHSLYWGHDFSTGWAVVCLVFSICLLVYAVLKWGKHHRVHAVFLFAYIILGAAMCATGIKVLYSTNGGNGRDEHRWTKEHNELIWKHSSAWDWMTQSFYYNYTYNNLWENLQRESKCCAVRGSYEIGAARKLWNNQTDIFSTFEFPMSCCKLDASEPGAAFKCRDPENHYDGCWDVAVYDDFVPLGAIDLTLSAINIAMVLGGTLYYILDHKPLYSC